MDLYLIRHAEAVSRDDAAYTDEERPLTEAGRNQCRMLARSLVSRNVQFDAVIASPLARARQTAEELLQNMPGPLADVEFCRHVAPGGKHRKLIRFYWASVTNPSPSWGTRRTCANSRPGSLAAAKQT